MDAISKKIREKELTTKIVCCSLFIGVVLVYFHKSKRSVGKEKKKQQPFESQDTRIWDIVGTDDQYRAGCSDKSFKHSIEFNPRSTDIIIATAPKTGTTWLQQICHQIRTGGDEEMEDIDKVSPWIQIAWDLGQNLNSEQAAFPRNFKSHQKLSSVNKGAKYLCAIREPVATFLSWYNFNSKKGRNLGTIDDFLQNKDLVTENMRHGANLWQYYVQFAQTCSLPNVFVVVYEDLVEDLEFFLPKIANFMNVDLPPNKIKTIAHLCSKDYMMENIDKFSEIWASKRRPKFSPPPPAGKKKLPTPGAKVTNGNHRVNLSKASLLLLETKWKEIVEAQTGIQSYEELRELVRKNY
mmetsp:Transcript_4334/g.5594  ORF Transcript_4334/g.5594 Transcript_4334/m.5594 type:complete len:352 (-) Transcript_4334:100-1155(-)